MYWFQSCFLVKFYVDQNFSFEFINKFQNSKYVSVIENKNVCSAFESIYCISLKIKYVSQILHQVK